jgi:hypothetical protein
MFGLCWEGGGSIADARSAPSSAISALALSVEPSTALLRPPATGDIFVGLLHAPVFDDATLDATSGEQTSATLPRTRDDVLTILPFGTSGVGARSPSSLFFVGVFFAHVSVRMLSATSPCPASFRPSWPRTMRVSAQSTEGLSVDFIVCLCEHDLLPV